MFHRNQLIPHRDRIAIFAVIKDTETGLLDISEVSFFSKTQIQLKKKIFSASNYDFHLKTGQFIYNIRS